ncbi:hypothetical protein BDC45DRAFT_500091 [Circinella umbellata]|nr:hypothetical protein BDC45DRAFT_500091 [Circinella umbellata]
MLPFIWKQIKQTFLSEEKRVLSLDNNDTAIVEGPTMKSHVNNESCSRKRELPNCTKTIIDLTEKQSSYSEKEQEPPLKKQKYIAKRLGSAMTVPFMPLKSKKIKNYKDTEDIPEVILSDIITTTTTTQQSMNDDDNTLIKQNPIDEKDIYTTRSGRHVRAMTEEAIGCDSSDDDDEDPYYGGDSNSDNNIKLKKVYKKERLPFYCPYKGCNVTRKNQRVRIISHIRNFHDSSIETSRRSGVYVYACRRSGQEVLFNEESCGTLKPNDKLHLVKKKELQQQTATRTKKIEFSRVVSSDLVHDHDDFASKKTTKETMTKDYKQVKVRFYCPYKSCRTVFKQDNSIYNHVRKYHYKDFPVLEHGKPYSFITTNAEMLNFKNVSTRDLLSNGEPIIPKKRFK